MSPSMIPSVLSLNAPIVTAQEMRQIEERLFAAGMPVAALMEKAALLIARRIQQGFPVQDFPQVGIAVGPGHNGGDALVVARELFLAGYRVEIFSPFTQLKALTASHAYYARQMGIAFHPSLEPLACCDLIIDGLFGFGLTRSLTGEMAAAIETLNQWEIPIVSLDLPSGLHTDTGEVLGVAVKAHLSLCLGLWKRCFFQESALEYLGQAERLDLGIPSPEVWAVLTPVPPVQSITPEIARQYLPLPRPLVTHKYRQGHLLLICGSRRYGGGAILAGLGARASGVGMLSIAVPAFLKPLMLSYLPDALIIDCPETDEGAIASLPPVAADFEQYSVIACGPGLTMGAEPMVHQTLKAHCPLILDADALNIVAERGTEVALAQRTAPTILTPHGGEFKRLFPKATGDRWSSLTHAAQSSQAVILLKGAKTAIANPQGSLRIILDSTPALARGGSGDVLTGLMGGLMAQSLSLQANLLEITATAAYWHAQAGIIAACDRTELGVDAHTLTHYLNPALQKMLKTP